MLMVVLAEVDMVVTAITKEVAVVDIMAALEETRVVVVVVPIKMD